MRFSNTRRGGLETRVGVPVDAPRNLPNEEVLEFRSRTSEVEAEIERVAEPEPTQEQRERDGDEVPVVHAFRRGCAGRSRSR